jgi:hypothetical protein
MRELPKPTTVRLTYEYGIEMVRVCGPLWRLLRASPSGTPAWSSPSRFENGGWARLVLTTDVDHRRRLHTTLMSPGGGEPLSSVVSDVMVVRAYEGEHFEKVMNLLHMLEAACYHCIRLAEAYPRVCDWEVTMAARAPEPLPPERYSMSALSEVYFEFDALMAALRRVFESLRFLLWAGFGRGLGTIPGNFETTLEVLVRNARVPGDLSQRLQATWDTTGVRIKAYRDCAFHYVPLFSMFGYEVWGDEGEPWHAYFHVPDNPDARSVGQFTFEQKVDALRFGWESMSEIAGVLRMAVRAIPGIDGPVASGGADAQTASTDGAAPSPVV